MALEHYLKKRTIKSEMLKDLKTNGMDEQKLEHLAQKTALNWPDIKDIVPFTNEVRQR